MYRTNNDMRLSKNLTLAEATRSDTAKRKGIDNRPTGEHLSNLITIANKVFQPIRDHFRSPIRVTSGYRSEALNKIIGGSKTSQHCKGEALDLQGLGEISNAMIFDYIRENLEFDQMIWEFGTENEPDWVHVSFTSINRGQILMAYKEGNKTKYQTMA